MSSFSFPVFTIHVIIIAMVINMAISLYGVFAKPSLVKKYIALTIFSDSINTFAIIIGYRWVGRNPWIAVYPTSDFPKPEEVKTLLANFTKYAVDPVPQALVLTAIVIGLAVNMFLAGLIMLYMRYFGTVNVEKVKME